MATTKIRSSNQLYIDDVFNVNGFRVTGLGAPTGTTDAATKGYVDALKTGLDIKDSVRAATTATLTVTETLSTLTNAGAQAALTLDDITLSINDRVLIKDQTTGKQNGIFIVSDTGSVSTNWILSRAYDFDNAPSLEVTPGAFTFVEEGTINSDSGWVLTTNGTITIGTTSLSFAQFSGAGQIIAGNGLIKTGNQIDVVSTGSGALNITSDSINLSGITVSQTADGSNDTFVDSVTVDSFGRVTAVHKAVLGTINNLIVTGNTTLWGPTIVNNTLSVTGVTTLAGTTATSLGVSGLSTFQNINATGATTLAGATATSLGVSGLSTFQNVNATGTTTLYNFGSTGTATLNILNVTGATTLAGATATSLGVSGLSTFQNINATGATIMAGATATSLGVSGLSTFQNINATGTTTLWGSTTINNSLTVTGTTILGNLGSNGLGTFNNVNITGTTTMAGASATSFSGGQITGTTFTSTVTNGTAPLIINSNTKVNNLNSDLLDGYHATDFTNAFRKYRLNTSTATPGTTAVVFDYTSVTGVNAITTDSFELYKNGLLLNASDTDYSDTISINGGLKTITFTVVDSIFAGDVYLLNFSYTK